MRCGSCSAMFFSSDGCGAESEWKIFRTNQLQLGTAASAARPAVRHSGPTNNDRLCSRLLCLYTVCGVDDVQLSLLINPA
jgi:hypothetical protein